MSFIARHFKLDFLFLYAFRVCVAFGSLWLSFIIAKSYGAEGVGYFSLLQSVVIGGGVLSRFGMNVSCMKLFSLDGLNKNTFSYFLYSVLLSLCLSMVVYCVFLFSLNFTDLFDFLDLKIIVLLGVVSFSVASIVSGLFKGVSKPFVSMFFEPGASAFFTALIFFVIAYVGDLSFLVSVFYSTMAFLCFIALCYFFFKVEFEGFLLFFKRIYSTSLLIVSRSYVFFTLSLTVLFQNVFSIWAAAEFLTPAELGVFRMVVQLSMIISFSLLVINAIYPPKFARCYADNNSELLAVHARMSSRIAILMSLLPILICVFSPGFILRLIGDEFVIGSNALIIIALAQVINVSTGAVGSMLLMTGHEKNSRNIVVFGAAFGFILYFLLVPWMGIVGAALSYSSGLILTNVMSLFLVKRKLGIWMLP